MWAALADMQLTGQKRQCDGDSESPVAENKHEMAQARDEAPRLEERAGIWSLVAACRTEALWNGAREHRTVNDRPLRGCSEEVGLAGLAEIRRLLRAHLVLPRMRSDR